MVDTVYTRTVRDSMHVNTAATWSMKVSRSMYTGILIENHLKSTSFSTPPSPSTCTGRAATTTVHHLAPSGPASQA